MSQSLKRQNTLATHKMLSATYNPLDGALKETKQSNLREGLFEQLSNKDSESGSLLESRQNNHNSQS